MPARLRMYQRIVTLGTAQAEVSLNGTAEQGEEGEDAIKAGVSEIEDEMRDRFGPLPWQAVNLLYVTRLRLYAREAGIESVTRERNRVVLRYGGEIGGARRAMQRVLGRQAEIGNTQVRLPMDALGAGLGGCAGDGAEGAGGVHAADGGGADGEDGGLFRAPRKPRRWVSKSLVSL